MSSLMSDAELRQVFVKAGYKPGPCNPATRSTLELVLQKMNSGENVTKYFTQSVRSSAPVASVMTGAGETADAASNQRTPYDESMYDHPPVNTSTPTPSYAVTKTREIEAENLNPSYQFKAAKVESRVEYSQKNTIVSSSTNVSTNYTSSSKLSVPGQTYQQSNNALRNGGTTPVSKIHYNERDTNADFHSAERPSNVFSNPSAYYASSASRVYGTSSGSFNPRLVTPREPVKHTPVSTGHFDLRQRKMAASSTTQKVTSEAKRGGSSNFMLIILILLLAAAIGYYVIFMADEGDVAIPKITSGEDENPSAAE